MSEATDVGAEWLRNRRTGGSEEERCKMLEALAPVRDKILDDGEVGPGVTVLDVGCGDGLVGLGALERGAEVVFSDVSGACLDDCRAIAGDRARYVRASATDLGDVEADVVTTRSDLIYVDDKQRALDEFFRVLRPGGRVSIFEPINRFGLEERRETYGFADVGEIDELLRRLWREEEEDRVNEPMIDFDERDLLVLAERAGFVDIRLELHVEVKPEPLWHTRSWDVFVASSPNPLVTDLRRRDGSPPESRRDRAGDGEAASPGRAGPREDAVRARLPAGVQAVTRRAGRGEGEIVAQSH